MIEVKKIAECTYEVTVTDSVVTTHRVTLSDEDYHRLSGGKETPERLIERSFEFLLRREPNTSILGSFDLPVIGRYFPDYEQEIGGRLGT
jgi:hypothetical protein